MALPILDGNQTATTLSTVLTSGEHIPAHTVVSLGSVAISNITSAVSGSVVSISNFPASQSTTFGAVTGSVSVLNFPSTQTIAGTVTVGGFSSVSVGNNSLLVGGSRGGVITPIPLDNGSGKLSSIANIQYYDAPSYIDVSPTNPLPIRGTVTIGNSVTIGSIPAISGTVTANLNTIQEGAFGAYDSGSGTAINQNLVAVRGSDAATWLQDGGGNVPISGTVTANNPNGALTTRFGSVATANLAFITSAVTNTSRKYLLAQNISAGTVTIGIGFSPTTTQGIQLSAGGGLTFDAFCPTGAVYWLGAVTGAAFTILEG